MTLSNQTIAILVLLVFFVVFLVFVVLRLSSKETLRTQSSIAYLVSPAGENVTLAVEIADDPQERETGLMHRTALPAGTGMLFVFEREQQLSFWMKNTLIPLDILFFDRDGRFVSRASMTPCVTDPCPLTPAGAPVQYALEVNRNEVKTAEVGEGWMLRMDNGL